MPNSDLDPPVELGIQRARMPNSDLDPPVELGIQRARISSPNSPSRVTHSHVDTDTATMQSNNSRHCF